MMAEYIRREDAIKCIEGQCVDGKMWGNDESEGTLIDAYSAIDDLMEIPPADVAPVQHARWEVNESGYLVCTHCGWVRYGIPLVEHYPYCPSCGFSMDG